MVRKFLAYFLTTHLLTLNHLIVITGWLYVFGLFLCVVETIVGSPLCYGVGIV